MTSPPPASILIIGSGVFGLSTALALTRRSQYSQTVITVLDRSQFPSSDGSSIDNSRIIRADYSCPAYAALASRAQEEWRKDGPGELGGDGRYSESGLVLVSDTGCQGEQYVKSSWENIRSIMIETNDTDAIHELPDKAAIASAVNTGGSSGDWGYANHRSGWADAEAAMIWLKREVVATKRVTLIHGEAIYLLKSSDGKKLTVQGAKLRDGRTLNAELVILAAGAWTGALVDLRGRATATGQVLGYLSLTDEEQERLGGMPVLLNISTGLFIIPPKNRVLKVARHAYGYLNPVPIPNPDKVGIADGKPAARAGENTETITVSLPRTRYDDPTQDIPLEGLAALRGALADMIPSLSSRPFTHTRICWYSDTPRGDFLITYHPSFSGLFLATGDSGHGFKFLGVLGESIVDCIEGRYPGEFRDKWQWSETGVEVITEDGSRGGQPGSILGDEMIKGRKL